MKEEERGSNDDGAQVGPEPNAGIRQHTKGMQANQTDAHRVKKQRKAD